MGVESFAPWLVYWSVLKQFKRISVANGFNLNPLVIESPDQDNEKASEIIMVSPGAPYLNPVDDDQAFGTVFVEQQIAIKGWIFAGHRDPRERMHELMQDALNAFFPNRQTIRNDATVGVDIAMQQVETDENVLLRTEEAAFEFVVAVQYKQGPSW